MAIIIRILVSGLSSLFNEFLQHEPLGDLIKASSREWSADQQQLHSLVKQSVKLMFFGLITISDTLTRYNGII